MKKYTMEQFIKKYNGKRHISAGIHFEDGSIGIVTNVSCCQIASLKNVAYIITK